MASMVSKIRARKTKEREKQATKMSGGRISPRPHRTSGILICLVLAIAAMLLVSLETLITLPSGWKSLLSVAGDSIFVLIAIFAVPLFLAMSHPALLSRPSQVSLVALAVLLVLVPSKTLLHFSQSVPWLDPRIIAFAIPFAFVPFLTAILLNATVATVAGIATGLILAIMSGHHLPVFITALFATVTTASLAREVRTRSRVFKIGFIVGLAEICCLLGITALQWNDPTLSVRLVIYQAGACLAAGFLSSVFALLFLPLFEFVFHITTDIRLLELSDLGHPLLQRLAIEAPGTYHHSMIVAQLAQAAANDVGANSLLARVSAYFHDIGKLVKPDFFAENIRDTENPHDDLPPSMSSLVIISHVKEGLTLSALHRLPAPIQRIITEHHGTGLLSYFHYKAKSQLANPFVEQHESSNGEKEVDETVFRYPGPKPASRESAIVCLADAVEAASRSMEGNSPRHIEELVDSIVNTRLEDGQLDQCDLTIAELVKVKRSFVFTMTNMLHRRIPYPKDENRDKQPAKPSQDRPPADKEDGGAHGAAG